jgi:DNA-directed RNA polymerase subunit E'/Rpb7
MEYNAVFEEQIALTPKDMRIKIDSIDTLLQNKLQAKLEGRCSRDGFVQPGTLKILSRSMGNLEKGLFTGSILFHIQAEASVLNPPDGTVIKGEVIRKNKMGIYVSYMDAIRVIIPRDLHIGDETFEAVEIGQTVEVEIKKSRFQVNDPYVLSVGMFRSVKDAGAPAKNMSVKPMSVKPSTTVHSSEDVSDAEDESDENELADAFAAEEDDIAENDVE